MPYSPTLHHRRSIRLKGYDYSQSGVYFVTICVQDHVCMFGEVENGTMILNDVGKMAMRCWMDIPQHFPNVVLHEYVVMPNHIHGIIQITNDGGNAGENVGAKNFSPLPPTLPSPSPPSPSPRFVPTGTSRTIGSIVRGFKIGVTKQLGYSVWQRDYWERIIRDDDAYQNITRYIINNPVNWRNDDLNKKQ